MSRPLSLPPPRVVLLLCGLPAMASASAPVETPRGAWRKVPLPAVKAPDMPAPHPVTRLEAAGPYLLALRQGAGQPYVYTLLDATTKAGKVLWEARDACCGGPPPWDVLISPSGGGVAVLYPDGGAEARYRLLRPGQSPVALSPFSGGAWSADGSWLGGPLGAFSSDGRLLRPGVPDPQSTSEQLFFATDGAMLRYIDRKSGLRMAWSGSDAPRKDGPWACASHLPSRNLDGPSVAPVRFSPKGRYVAWSTRAGQVRICDGDTGQETALPDEVEGLTWVAPARLLYVRDGAVWDQTVGDRPVRLELPRGMVARSVAFAGGQLYVGTSKGEVHASPLP